MQSTCDSENDLPPQSQDLNVNEAVWDHLDGKWNKGSQHPKMSFECPLRTLQNYLQATHLQPEDYSEKLQ